MCLSQSLHVSVPVAPFQVGSNHMWLVAMYWTSELWWIRISRFCDKGSDANILFMSLTDMYPCNVLSEAYRQQHGVCCDFWIVPVIESTNHCGNSWSALNVVIAWKAFTRQAEKLVWNPECAYFSYPTDYFNFPMGSYSLTNLLISSLFSGVLMDMESNFFLPALF